MIKSLFRTNHVEGLEDLCKLVGVPCWSNKKEMWRIKWRGKYYAVRVCQDGYILYATESDFDGLLFVLGAHEVGRESVYSLDIGVKI